MTINTLESPQSRRRLDESLRWSDRQAAAEQLMAEEFIQQAQKPLHLPAMFAPTWLGHRPTMAEVLTDAIDYADFNARALQILCDVAFGRGDRQADAKELLAQMADKFASMHAEVE